MSATSYRSGGPLARDGFAQLLRAEWTKFRTVRGWVIGTLFAALLIVMFAYLATFRHQDGGICVGPNPATGTCRSFAHPTPPIAPDGTPVYDTYAFAHRTLTGDGSITVRIGALTGLIQGGGNGHSTSIQDMVGGAGPVQPWAKAGLILRASDRPGAAYAAVMLTGAHGVRMQYDYTHDTAGPGASARWLRLTRSGTALTGYASADGTHWTRIGSATIVGLTAERAGRAVRHLAADRADAAGAGARPGRPGHRCDGHLRPASPSGWMVPRRMGHARRERQRAGYDRELRRLQAVPVPIRLDASPGQETSDRRSAPGTPIGRPLRGCSSA